MTDRIDLDELDVQADEEDDQPNRGDWFWGDDDGAETAPEADAGQAPAGDDASGASADAGGSASDADADGWRSGAARAEELGADEPDPTTYDDDLGADLDSSTPRVPYADDDKPVGIPRQSGGGGGVAADAREEETQEQPAATGPHGETKSEMTMAVSYRAIRRLSNLHAALADAETWTDYVGIVGDVDAHVINKFQRENRLDLDFFNGTGTGPGERLAEVGPNSMFYADRMVLVGVEDAGERAWAEEAGWEFVPLAEAAEASGWAVEDADDDGDATADETADEATDARVDETPDGDATPGGDD